MLKQPLSITLLVAIAVMGVSALLPGSAVTYASAAVKQEGVKKTVLPKEVAQAFSDNCLACHGPKKQKGGVRLDTLDPDFIKGIHAEDWHDALNAIQLGDMPPKGQPPLPDKDRRAIESWITGELKRAKDAKTQTGGKAVLRRMTRYEYNNTMADLLGIEWDYAENLPPDSKSKDGFENNGQALGISPIQLEYYLKAARLGLSKAIVEGGEPEVVIHRDITKGQGPGKGSPYTPHQNGLVRPGDVFRVNADPFPREGEVRIKVLVDEVEIPESQGYPQMLIRIGLRADIISQFATFARTDVIPTQEGGPIEMVFTGRIEHMPLPGHNPKYPGISISVVNDYQPGDDYKKRKKERDKGLAQIKAFEKKNQKAKKQGKPLPTPPDIQVITLPEMPTFVVKSVSFEGPIFDAWPPAHHRQILFDRPAEMDESSYAKSVIKRFIDRAYRRPATKADVARVFDFYQHIRPSMPSFESAIRESLAMVLISPEFLYLVEPEVQSGSPARLTDHELATRLSYFLWSTMPDKALRDAADKGLLSKPAELERQVRRMIKDDRSQAFVEHFTSQWLDLPGVDRVAVNPQYYPGFDDKLKVDMKRETVAFFGEVLRKGESAFNLIDSDFVMVNRPLAIHYGLPVPKGSAFERVALEGTERRGGLLTQASVMLMNSNGEDSHPIRRAVWLRHRLLDDPPAPPPPDVPDLDSSNPKFASLPLKKQLELHREKASCNDCHLRIDPWGIPLENYDAVGRWRDEVDRVVGRKKTKSPVVSDAVLPGGQTVAGIDDLKAVLKKDYEEHFARGLVRYTLAYSLGRSLDYTDRDDVDTLVNAFEESGYRIDELLVEIVKSEAFNTK